MVHTATAPQGPLPASPSSSGLAPQGWEEKPPCKKNPAPSVARWRQYGSLHAHLAAALVAFPPRSSPSLAHRMPCTRWVNVQGRKFVLWDYFDETDAGRQHWHSAEGLLSPSWGMQHFDGQKPKNVPVYIQSWAFQVTEEFLPAFLVVEAHRSKMNTRDKNN